MFSLECLSKLFEQARNGNAQARDQLVLDNTGLVWSVVKKYRGRGYEQEDLFQIGCIGLMKAIDRFDQTFGVCFSTYAVPMIIGEIRRFLRDDGMIKVSRTVKETAAAVPDSCRLNMRLRMGLNLRSVSWQVLCRLHQRNWHQRCLPHRK